MTMTPEEQFNQYVWWVLKKIKQAALTTPKNSPLEYELSNLAAAGVPSKKTERNILYKLQEWQAIEVLTETPTDWRVLNKHSFELRLLSKFDEIYVKYKIACDEKSYLNAFQKKIFQNLKDSKDWEENLPKPGVINPPIDSDESNKIQPKDRSVQKTKPFNSQKLIFYPADGITLFMSARYQFTGKGRALLTFLSGSKNTPFSLNEIKARCNPNITNPMHHFKNDKDMRDIVNYIRKKLKVNDGEFFPILKQNNNWIWLEKY